MNKRIFLRQSVLAAAALSTPPILNVFAQKKEDANTRMAPTAGYTLPPLPYAYNALEPFIDSRTMELHHSKHHATYVEKLNTLLLNNPAASLPIEKLMASITEFPDGVRNNGGGHYNHTFFWQILQSQIANIPNFKKPINAPGAPLAQAIMASFGSFAAFQEQFTNAATSRFGSGWAWLIKLPGGKLAISSTANQDNPLMPIAGNTLGQPILALDVWEHAYYLKYQNKRADYIKAFFSIINWQEADRLFSI
jgi:superoxide dismutase, Fe-Mn family